MTDIEAIKRDVKKVAEIVYQAGITIEKEKTMATRKPTTSTERQKNLGRIVTKLYNLLEPLNDNERAAVIDAAKVLLNGLTTQKGGSPTT